MGAVAGAAEGNLPRARRVARQRAVVFVAVGALVRLESLAREVGVDAGHKIMAVYTYDLLMRLVVAGVYRRIYAVVSC
jgi:hypothetical protein